MIEHLHRTIRNLYPNALSISGISESDIIAEDSDGNEVTLDWTSINAKRTELQAEYDAQEYARSRKGEYPDIGDQLDDLFKAGAFSTEMTAKIQAVKDKYPKE